MDKLSKFIFPRLTNEGLQIARFLAYKCQVILKGWSFSWKLCKFFKEENICMRPRKQKIGMKHEVRAKGVYLLPRTPSQFGWKKIKGRKSLSRDWSICFALFRVIIGRLMTLYACQVWRTQTHPFSGSRNQSKLVPFFMLIWLVKQSSYLYAAGTNGANIFYLKAGVLCLHSYQWRGRAGLSYFPNCFLFFSLNKSLAQWTYYLPLTVWLN